MVNTEPSRELMLEAEIQEAYTRFFTEERKQAVLAHIEKTIQNSDLEQGEIDEMREEAVESETMFAKKIIRAFVRWSKEQEPVVYWDIDDTLGKQTTESDVFLVRSSIVAGKLFEFLRDVAPNVTHAILSTRSEKGINTFLKYSTVGSYFDRTLSQSTRGVDHSVVDDGDNRFLPGAKKKLHILRTIKAAGQNPKWIDDFAGPEEVLGEDGVCVQDCRPSLLSYVA